MTDSESKNTKSIHLTPEPAASRSSDIHYEHEESAIKSIRVPMPQIVPDNMELWFIQIEHWFKVVGIISDNQKFSTVVSALDAKLLQQVFNIVRNPPPTNRFQAIVDAIVHNFAESEQQRIQQLISGIQLGDRKPSHLLNDLRRASGDSQDEKLLKGLWMKRLPVEVQICLETVSTPLSKLAELADTVMDTFRIGTSGGVVNVATAVPDGAANPIDILTNEVKRLSKEVNRMQVELRQRSRSRTRSFTPRRQSTSTASRSTKTDDTMCWYHNTYAENANKCRSPCSWKEKN